VQTEVEIVLKQHESVPAVHAPPPQLEETNVAKNGAGCLAPGIVVPGVQFSPVILRNFIPVLTTAAERATVCVFGAICTPNGPHFQKLFLTHAKEANRLPSGGSSLTHWLLNPAQLIHR
jgi:hypothetical protein